MRRLLVQICFVVNIFYGNGVRGGGSTISNLHFTQAISIITSHVVSYEGEGKGFTQQKYAAQIFRRPLKELFSQPGDFFCVEDNSKVHGKSNTRKNRGLCNAVRLEC